jgi:hypothetical protein
VDHLDIVPLGRALAGATKEFCPEVVHCWSDLANVIGGLVGSNLGVPKLVLGQRNVPAFRYVDGIAPYLCRDATALSPGIQMF